MVCVTITIVNTERSKIPLILNTTYYNSALILDCLSTQNINMDIERAIFSVPPTVLCQLDPNEFA